MGGTIGALALAPFPSYKPSYFTDLDNSCYKLKDCPAGQISAKEKCQNVTDKTPKMGGNAPDKCLLKSPPKRRLVNQLVVFKPV